MEQRKGRDVFGFRWDLSNGLIRHYVPKLTIPFEHVGILVYNTLYEFNSGGIRKKKIRPKEVPVPFCRVRGLIHKEKLGQTFKCKEEFEEWLENQCEKDLQYDVLRNNCVSFAIRACNFLGVAPSPQWFNVSRIFCISFYVPFRNYFMAATKGEEEKLERFSRFNIFATDIILATEQNGFWNKLVRTCV
jgi:hypothetical protein